MRILHAIDLLSPVGGAQTYVCAVTELLAEAGHEVAILHKDAYAQAPAGVHVEQLGRSESARWVAEFDPEVFHAHDDTDMSPLQACAVVRSFHNFAFACASGTKYFRDGSLCRRPHGPGCLLAAPAKGCVHRSDPRPFIARYREIARTLPGRGRGETCVFHSDYMRTIGVGNGVDGARAIPYFVGRARAPTAPPPGRTLAFAGRIVPDKGLDLLLEGLTSCGEAWDRLLIAGDGWDRARCEQLARSNGLAERVSFLGHLSTSEVRALFAQVRVVVVPSRWPEPFGIVGLEAMAQARAVVATRAGGIPEWLADGETGLLVEPGSAAPLGEAVSALLADPERADAMGSAGWEAVAAFSAEEHLRQLVKLYADLSEAHASESFRRTVTTP